MPKVQKTSLRPARGFQNWTLATAIFREHELSAFHKEEVERIITLPAAPADIGVAIKF